MKFRISSTIANWKDRIFERYHAQEYRWPQDKHEKTVFWGMYGPHDYKKLLNHKGERVIWWCGTDILHLQERKIWQKIIRFIPAMHYCENIVEKKALKRLGIDAQIRYIFLGNTENFPISYQPSDTPHVWMSARPGYEKMYGVDTVLRVASSVPEVTFHIYGIGSASGKLKENVIMHGHISEENLDQEIKKYQAGIRLNEFDGMSDIVSKSILLGQETISKIWYPFVKHIKDDEELVRELRALKYRKEPDLEKIDFYKRSFNSTLI